MLNAQEGYRVRRRFTLDSNVITRKNVQSCANTNRMTRRNMSSRKRVGKLVQNPILLQIYPLLIKQQKVDLKEHFETFRPLSLKRDRDSASLLVELFNYSNQVEEAIEKEIEVIVANKFTLQPTKANYLETSKGNDRTLSKIQKHTSFEELLRSGYDRYKQEFFDNELKNTSRCSPKKQKEEVLPLRKHRLSSHRSEGEEEDGDCISIENSIKGKRYKSFIGLNSFSKLNTKAEKNTASTLRSIGREHGEEEKGHSVVKIVKRLDFGHIKRKSRVIKLN